MPPTVALQPRLQAISNFGFDSRQGRTLRSVLKFTTSVEDELLYYTGRRRSSRVKVSAHRRSALSSALGPSNGTKWSANQWLENSASADVNVPVEQAWALWEDRARIPQWMNWITSVDVQPEDTTLSKWTLSTYQFNNQWKFSWLAKNLTPVKYQKIHWRSVPGGSNLGALEVENRGQIRFMKKGKDKCSVKLTISYAVPSVLAPFANLLTPLVERILANDMAVFAKYAEEELMKKK